MGKLTKVTSEQFEEKLRLFDKIERKKGHTIHSFIDTWKYFWQNYKINKKQFSPLFNNLLHDWQRTKLSVHGTIVGETTETNHLEHKGRWYTIWSFEHGAESQV